MEGVHTHGTNPHLPILYLIHPHPACAQMRRITHGTALLQALIETDRRLRVANRQGSASRLQERLPAAVGSPVHRCAAQLLALLDEADQLLRRYSRREGVATCCLYPMHQPRRCVRSHSPPIPLQNQCFALLLVPQVCCRLPSHSKASARLVTAAPPGAS